MSGGTAMVTGAGTGIGKAIAIALAKNGYDIVISYYSNEPGAIQTCQDIRKMGRQAFAVRADLSEISGIKQLFRESRTYFDHLDVFVNTSGITKKSRFLETSEEMIDALYRLDLKGAFFCIQHAANWMIQAGIPGSIVVISSNNHKAHFPQASAYGIMKAALTKLTEHAAMELARYKIRVNTIAPGWTDTGAARLGDKESTYYKIPLKRWCHPEEIGEAAVFLSSEAAQSITGATLIMDGGAVLLSDKPETYE